MDGLLSHPLGRQIYQGREGALARHDKTMIAVKTEIGRLIREHAADARDLLEVGAETGLQTLFYRDQLASPRRTVAYDWRSFLAPNAKGRLEFARVDLETARFPDPDESFDVVVCNQVLEHLKNVHQPLSEMVRVLRPNGFLIVSVPNLAALHNVALLALGWQPTTTAIAGSHVRGFAIRSMSRFLTENGHLRIRALSGFGLHPLVSRALPRLLRAYCHTPIWLCQKQRSARPTWTEARRATFTTTSFFADERADA